MDPTSDERPGMADSDAGPDLPPEPEAGGSEGPDGGAGGSRRARKKRSFGRHVLRWVMWTLVAVTLVVFALLQTGQGQNLVVDGALSRIRDSLAGELTVGTVRSGTLLTGATLIDVRVTAEGGREFFRADSLEVRYSPLALLRGAPRVRDVTVWGLGLEISRYGGEPSFNVTRLVRRLAGADTAITAVVEAADSARSLSLGTVQVRGGTIEILSPIADGQRASRALPSPDGEGDLRRMAFEDLDFEVADVSVSLSAGDTLFHGQLRAFATHAAILPEELVIQDARGDLVMGSEGLSLTDGRFRMPASRLAGELRVGPRASGGPWVFRTTLATERPSQLRDLTWLDERIPGGTYSGAATVTIEDGIRVGLDGAVIEVGGSTVGLDGNVRFADEMGLDNLTVDASPLALERLEPWIPRDVPIDGFVRGAVTFSGTFSDLTAAGRATLVPAGYNGAPTTLDFSGTLHQGTNPGATNLSAVIAPVNYRLLDLWLPDFPLEGDGRLDVEVSGRADQGLQVRVDATHRAAGVESRGNASGTMVRSSPGDWTADLTGALEPLALELLASVRPDLQLGGEVSGPVSARGRLRDLQVTGDLQTEDGQFILDGVVDARRLGSFYRLDIEGRGVSLSRLSSRLPEPSEWNGLLSIEGRGLAPDSMDATATLALTSSRIGGLHIDTISANLRASGGILTVDSLAGVLGKVEIAGSGRLGIVAPLDGEARLTFQTDSLIGLRPLLLGDSVTAKDTLSVLERDFLGLQGVDVASLPDTADVRMRGSVQGVVRLVGSVDALDVELDMSVRDAVYGPNRVDSATVRLTAGDLPAFDGAWDVTLDAFGVEWEERAFRSVQMDGDMDRQAGRATLDVERRVGEVLQADGGFALDSLGARIQLDQASVSLDNLGYLLERPAVIQWTRNSLEIEDLGIRRADDDPMAFTASGTLSRSGESDFHLVTEGLHLGRLIRVAEIPGWDIAGHTDLDLRVTGPANAPVIDASFTVEEPRLDEMVLTSLDGVFHYSDQDIELDMSASDDGGIVFSVDGNVPYDLGLAEIADRAVRRPMDLSITADSIDAAVALAYFSDLEDVAGKVTADVRVRGTTERPEPDGSIQLEGGGWSLDAIGVRHSAVSGGLRLRPDRTIDVDLATFASGSSTVRGTMSIEDLTDPALDLAITFAGFQAVDRLDIEGRISGDLTLTGRYSRPVIQGDLSVDRGTLFVDEFARNATVVDLLDPRLFADTTAFSAQPLLRDIRNPFLERLTVDVQLDVPRDTWLRSPDMSVEIGGQDLTLLYDRSEGDVVLVGDLEALRGSYRIFGRTFNVSEGTVRFLGFPGINPTLDIEATTRVRRLDDPPLNVTANVTGTLTLPQVDLSSDEAGLVQSDLLSYLLLGRPSSELATGQQAFLNSAVGTATNVISGVVAAQLGSALAEGIGLDYLSITQAGDFGFASTSLAGFANTQVEIGQYLGPNAFLVLVFRPLSSQGAEGDLFGGTRLEWALSDDYTFEGFWEDRSLRTRTGAFGNLGDQGTIVGAFIFREWGY